MITETTTRVEPKSLTAQAQVLLLVAQQLRGLAEEYEAISEQRPIAQIRVAALAIEGVSKELQPEEAGE